MNNEYSHTQNEDEIDLMELVQKIWAGRKTIFKFLIIFGIIGLFVAIFSETEYTASTTVIPQTSSGNKMGGSLGGCNGRNKPWRRRKF